MGIRVYTSRRPAAAVAGVFAIVMAVVLAVVVFDSGDQAQAAASRKQQYQWQ